MVRRTSDRGRLDRRLAPRPLAAHLASAMLLWSSSRTVLPILKDALLLSSEARERLHGLAAEIDAVGPSSVAAALDLEITRRAQSYLAGLEAYRRHPYRRSGDSCRAVLDQPFLRSRPSCLSAAFCGIWPDGVCGRWWSIGGRPAGR